MYMADLAGIVGDVEYLTSGYAALVKQGTLEVIAYGGRTGDFYDANSQTFKRINDVEPGVSAYLSTISSLTQGVFEFEKPGTQEAWYVAHVPFLSTTNYKTGQSFNALVALVFVKKSEALSTIPPMKRMIGRTTASIILIVLLGSIGTGLIVALTLLLLVQSLANTLQVIQGVSKLIVAMQSEEFRYYGDILKMVPWVTHMDELGMLMSRFGYMVGKLHAMQARAILSGGKVKSIN
jgi:hypothetical protein